MSEPYEVSDQDDPQATRYAVLAPHAALYFLNELKREGVTSATVRASVQWRLNNGYLAEGAAIAQAWRQLNAAATREAQRVTSARGSAEVDLAEVEPELSQEVTTTEAADMLRCSPRWVRTMMESGRLPGSKLGTVWFVDRSNVQALSGLRTSA